MRTTARVAAVLFAVCASVLVVASPAHANAGTVSVDAAGTVHHTGTADGIVVRVENLTATTVQLSVHLPNVLSGPGLRGQAPAARRSTAHPDGLAMAETRQLAQGQIRLQ